MHEDDIEHLPPGSICSEEAEIVVLACGEFAYHHQRIALNRIGRCNEIVHIYFVEKRMSRGVVEYEEAPHITHAGEVDYLCKLTGHVDAAEYRSKHSCSHHERRRYFPVQTYTPSEEIYNRCTAQAISGHRQNAEVSRARLVIYSN